MSTEERLRSMSLEEKVGQTIFPATRPMWPPEPWLADAIREGGIGGLLLREGGMRDAVALGARTSSDALSHGRVPLVLTADMERGVGDRLAGGTVFPANLALGAVGDPARIWRQGEITGEEARAAGVSLVLAPVLDILGREESAIVGTRAYGDDPDLVARLGAAFIEGCAASRCGTCAKHFPGHGEALEDSHAALPEVRKGIDALRAHEIVPFARAIEAGVHAVMIGHIRLPAIDGPDGPPASLSPRVIRTLLREEMGFGGLVITDALLMGGITTVLAEEAAAVRALAAGADILLCPTSAGPIHRAVARAVREGALPIARLEDAVARILAFKAEMGLFHPEGRPGAAAGGLPEDRWRDHRAEAARAAEGATCLLQNEEGALPVPAGEAALIVVAPDRPDPWAGRAFIDEIGRRSPVTVHHLFPGWGPVDWRRVETLAERVEAVIWAAIGRPAAWSEPGPARGSGEALPGRRTVVVALGSPALLDRAPRGAAALCTFSDSDVSQEAAGRAIFGDLPFRGRMPIDGTAGRRGEGLTLG